MWHVSGNLVLLTLVGFPYDFDRNFMFFAVKGNNFRHVSGYLPCSSSGGNQRRATHLLSQ
jgi:hypothetical protein